MKKPDHYDIIALGYEYFTEKLHGGHRREAIELLRVQPGQTIVDVPCGTGANFPLLEPLLGPAGTVVGCDYSHGMLARARSKVTAAGWDNVTLVEADARTITVESLDLAQPADGVICMLGLSVVPDWQLAFDRMYDVVRPGGRVVVMDLYLEGKRTSWLADHYYQVIARAHSKRRFWEQLEQRSEQYEVIDHPWFGGIARIAAGTKPSQ